MVTHIIYLDGNFNTVFTLAVFKKVERDTMGRDCCEF